MKISYPISGLTRKRDPPFLGYSKIKQTYSVSKITGQETERTSAGSETIEFLLLLKVPQMTHGVMKRTSLLDLKAGEVNKV